MSSGGCCPPAGPAAARPRRAGAQTPPRRAPRGACTARPLPAPGSAHLRRTGGIGISISMAIAGAAAACPRPLLPAPRRCRPPGVHHVAAAPLPPLPPSLPSFLPALLPSFRPPALPGPAEGEGSWAALALPFREPRHVLGCGGIAGCRHLEKCKMCDGVKCCTKKPTRISNFN